MTVSASQKFRDLMGMKQDVLGAGMHLLSGASKDLQLLVQQAVNRVMANAYVRREEYESLLARVQKLERDGAPAARPAATKKPAKPTKSKAKPAKRKTRN